MLELDIFVILFITMSIVAIISTFGCIKKDRQNDELLLENCSLEETVYSQEMLLEKLRAENRFLRLQLEEKKDVQKSKKNINA